MSEIAVCLSSSNTIPIDSDPLTARLIEMDIPICYCEVSLLYFDSNFTHSEWMENKIAEICKDMAKYVIVDCDKKTVYVGDDINGHPDFALIEYQCNEDLGVYEKHFFDRWKILNELVLQFVFLGNDSKPRFCLKGAWSKNQWTHLSIEPSSNIFISEPPKRN